jgi:hypothetical protein
MLFIRVSLGFGWWAEGMEPLPVLVGDEYDGGTASAGDTMKCRKRKRLDVLNRRKSNAGDCDPTDADADSERICKEKQSPAQDGIGEVGRLYIWCVKA